MDCSTSSVMVKLDGNDEFGESVRLRRPIECDFKAPVDAVSASESLSSIRLGVCLARLLRPDPLVVAVVLPRVRTGEGAAARAFDGEEAAVTRDFDGEEAATRVFDGEEAATRAFDGEEAAARVRDGEDVVFNLDGEAAAAPRVRVGEVVEFRGFFID